MFPLVLVEGLEHDCLRDLGQLMEVVWVILGHSAGIASAIEWLVPMLDKVLSALGVPLTPATAAKSLQVASQRPCDLGATAWRQSV